MTPEEHSDWRRRPTAICGAVAVAAYAWWATGRADFTPAAYLAVALPAASVALGLALAGGLTPGRREVDAHYARVAADVRAGGQWWWAGLLAAALALEAAGLALGGGAAWLPTLSDVTDRVLAPHLVRSFAFVAWLAVGITAVVRLRSATPAPRHPVALT